MKNFSKEEAKETGDKIGIDWSIYSLEQFTLGINIELEHGIIDSETNVTNDDPILTGKIAFAHLKEVSNYYDLLGKMEEEAKKNKIY